MGICEVIEDEAQVGFVTCCDPLVDAEHETLLVSGCFTPEQLQSGVLDGVTCQNVSKHFGTWRLQLPYICARALLHMEPR